MKLEFQNKNERLERRNVWRDNGQECPKNAERCQTTDPKSTENSKEKKKNHNHSNCWKPNIRHWKQIGKKKVHEPQRNKDNRITSLNC